MNKLFTALLSSCFIFACGGSQEQPVITKPPVVLPVPEVPKAEATPDVVPQPAIEWHEYNNGEVFKVAEENSDLLFLLFYSDACKYCNMYAADALTDKCVIKESKDGFVFSKLDISTKEGFSAYAKHTEARPDENGEIEILVPTTIIFSTVKEVPGFSLKIAKANGMVSSEKLCKAMIGLREAHRNALKEIKKELNP